jgi:hypothetical protein
LPTSVSGLSQKEQRACSVEGSGDATACSLGVRLFLTP